MIFKATLGALYSNNGVCQFRVWAPSIDKLEVHITGPKQQYIPLEKDEKGYHSVISDSIQPGSKYFYRVRGGIEYPDPASRFQPEGVHGPSQIVATDYSWEDNNWTGISLENYVIYELHVGSFTPEGTFKAVVPLLEELKNLGITAVELMPVAQFPGMRNWGYDGVFPFAVQNSYGGPEGLKKLVNACHKKGLAVILDVVYNHLGPEGNYFKKYGTYFTDRYKTPWGEALNFDRAFSDEVRRFFIENAVYWITEFHIDALRLDALHAILDMSAEPFLSELSNTIKNLRERSNKHIYLIGESDANDRRVVLSAEHGGYGIDAQWNDDFHHVLHAILTGERNGYYRDFGQVAQIAKAFREGFVYSGQYSKYRQRRHGSSSKDVPAEKLVVFVQNHDQVGNRMLGERLNCLVPFEKLKLAAGVLILSPFIPLIFMGQEYGEPAPFQYFTDHSDPALIEAVRKGRQEEFASFEYQGNIPDPQAKETFLCAKLDHNLKRKGKHRILFKLYQELLRMRREIPVLSNLSKNNLEIISYEKTKLLYIHRWYQNSHAVLVCNFNNCRSSIVLPVPAGHWRKCFDSAATRWLGKGPPALRQFDSKGERGLTLEANSCVLYVGNREEA